MLRKLKGGMFFKISGPDRQALKLNRLRLGASSDLRESVTACNVFSARAVSMRSRRNLC